MVLRQSWLYKKITPPRLMFLAIAPFYQNIRAKLQAIRGNVRQKLDMESRVFRAMNCCNCTLDTTNVAYNFNKVTSWAHGC